MIPFYSSSDPLVWLLAGVILLPLVAGLVLLFMPYRVAERWADTLGLGVVVTVFFSVMLLWRCFTPTGPSGYDYLSTTPLGLELIGVRLQLGLNALSLPMFVLSALVGAAAGFYTYGRALERRGLFWSFLLLVLAATLAAFSSVDLFYAFFFHEVALLPVLLSLMIYGGPERKAAALEMGVMLLVGSFITLLGVLAFHHASDLKSFSAIDFHRELAVTPLAHRSKAWALLLWGTVILSGLWPFYGWVPKLLAQAPTAISMMMGGALKFFGVYFLLQGFAGPSLWGLMPLRHFVSLLCVANIVFLSFAALAQTDFRKLVAYAATAHLGTVFLGFLSHTHEGMAGMMLLIFGSGLAVALLLLCCGFLRRRVGSLEMLHLGGLRLMTPQLSVFLMMGVLALLGLPVFVSFWGELGVLVGAMKGLSLVAPVILLGIALLSAAGIRALGGMLYGQSKPPHMADLSSFEALCGYLLVLPLLVFAFLPGVLTAPLNAFLQTFIPLSL